MKQEQRKNPPAVSPSCRVRLHFISGHSDQSHAGASPALPVCLRYVDLPLLLGPVTTRKFRKGLHEMNDGTIARWVNREGRAREDRRESHSLKQREESDHRHESTQQSRAMKEKNAEAYAQQRCTTWDVAMLWISFRCFITTLTPRRPARSVSLAFVAQIGEGEWGGGGVLIRSLTSNPYKARAERVGFFAAPGLQSITKLEAP